MPSANLGLTAFVNSVGGTQGQILVNGAVGAQVGAVVLSLDRPIVSGAASPINATATGAYNIDLTNSPYLQTLTITGATLFSGVNYAAGSITSLRVNAAGSNAIPIRFPDTWSGGWVNIPPTGLAASRLALFTVTCFVANDTGCALSWLVAP